MKATVSTEWLSGCSGCHVAMVDLHEKLLKLVGSVEFLRIPVLVDQRGYPQADIGIVEGAVRSAEDREALLKMRETVRILIAFGTCAVYGGPSGIGWLYDGCSVLGRAYGAGPTNAPGEGPDAGVPQLEQSVVPIDEVVKVDMYLPGCPPHPYWIAAAISSAINGDTSAIHEKTVCSRCKRRMRKREGARLQRGAVSADDPEMCLLSQGVVCLGSVTMERCLAQCPNRGVACSGCAGPSADIITEPHYDIRTLVSRRMSMLTGIAEEEIREYIEEEARTFYGYAMASPVMFRKPTVELREWAMRTTEAVEAEG